MLDKGFKLNKASEFMDTAGLMLGDAFKPELMLIGNFIPFAGFKNRLREESGAPITNPVTKFEFI